LDVNTTDIFSLEAVGFHFCFGMVYFNDFACKISGYKVDFVVLRMKLLVGGGGWKFQLKDSQLEARRL